MVGKIRTLRLTPDYEIKNFDCGDEDINDFFFKRLCPTEKTEGDDTILMYYNL